MPTDQPARAWVAKKAKNQEESGKRAHWWKRLQWDNRKWIQTFHVLENLFIAALLWNAHRLFRIAIGEEFGGPFQETFTYCIAGLKVGYQIHKYWRTELGYEFIVKNSELPLRDFYRNRVSLGLSFSF